MKNMILALAVTASAVSAFARPPHYGHGHGCYNCGADDAFTLGAALGSLSVSTLNCSANYDCKQVEAAHDDLVFFVQAQGADYARTAAVNEVLAQVRNVNAGSQDYSDTELAAMALQKAALQAAAEVQ